MAIKVQTLVDNMKSIGSSWAATLLFLSVGTLALALLPLRFSPYIVDLALRVILYGAIGSGLNIFTGLTGYVNFGYSAFVGVGAYALSISMQELGAPWYLGLPMGIGAGFITALIVGIPLLRIKEIHFALATVALASALNVASHTEFLEPLTHGATGIAVRSGLSLTQKYYLLLGACLAELLVCAILLRSRIGLQLLALRDDEDAAGCLGVPTGALKLLSFCLSGAIAGAFGAIYAIHLAYIDPNIAFDIGISLRALVLVLIGGFGTVFGPIIGSAIMTTLSEIVWARFLGFHLLVFGLFLTVSVLLMPRGILIELQRRRVLPRSRSW